MELSVVTVTHNNGPSIERYFDSLVKFLPQNYEIVIVDSGSVDNTPIILEKIKCQAPKRVVVILCDENIGFSKGCNLGAKSAEGKLLFFLNPDTVALNSCFEGMVGYYKAHQDVGILAPQLVQEDGSVQESVSRFPTFLGAVGKYLLNQQDAYGQYVPNSSSAVQVEAVYGAAMLIKRDLFFKIKGFDERYFLYYEDLDLCRKINKEMYKIIYFPEAKFGHSVGLSTKKANWNNMSRLLKIAANFIPIRESGSKYYQVQSGIIYHGFLVALSIRLIIYMGVKLHIFRGWRYLESVAA